MSWIDNLKNIEPFSLNESLINNSNDLTINMINVTNSQGGTYWYYSIILVCFFALVYLLYKKDDHPAFDIVRSTFFASGIMIFISGGMLISQLTRSALPTIWFTIIWFLTGLAVMSLRDENR